MSDLMRQNPGFDVNKDLGSGETLLHHACSEDSSSAVIPLLLAHPDIDVHLKNRYGQTPFYLACANGRPSCVREMLKDSRVKVTEPDKYGFTPLWWASRDGHIDIIKWWIASGRELDLGTPRDVNYTDAIEVAKERGKTEVVALLERFKKNLKETRQAVRVGIDWYNSRAAEMFAVTANQRHHDHDPCSQALLHCRPASS